MGGRVKERERECTMFILNFVDLYNFNKRTKKFLKKKLKEGLGSFDLDVTRKRQSPEQ